MLLVSGVHVAEFHRCSEKTQDLVVSGKMLEAGLGAEATVGLCLLLLSLCKPFPQELAVWISSQELQFLLFQVLTCLEFIKYSHIVSLPRTFQRHVRAGRTETQPAGSF